MEGQQTGSMEGKDVVSALDGCFHRSWYSTHCVCTPCAGPASRVTEEDLVKNFGLLKGLLKVCQRIPTVSVLQGALLELDAQHNFFLSGA